MPWKEPMEEKTRFVLQAESGMYGMSELCAYYKISRKTGYKWLRRFRESGLEGLREMSRRHHSHPHKTPKDLEAAIIDIRMRHERWGPKKLHRILQREHPDIAWPVPSTIGSILKREGLIRPAKKRGRTAPYSLPFAGCQAPNTTWCADFKGWFRTGDKKRCEPLTISDAHTRYLLRCQGFETIDTEACRKVFEEAFYDFGLPLAIRTDNGVPFASRAVGGLSRLSIWFIKLGITPERIQPGKPAQNGRHERIHLTLKQDILDRPEQDLATQQQAFDKFVHTYNHERPHEALNMDTPAMHYKSSKRPYTGMTPKIDYPEHYIVRKVRSSGEIKWRGGHLFLSEALYREPVGIRQRDDRFYDICFGHLKIATLDDFKKKIIKTPVTLA